MTKICELVKDYVIEMELLQDRSIFEKIPVSVRKEYGLKSDYEVDREKYMAVFQGAYLLSENRPDDDCMVPTDRLIQGSYDLNWLLLRTIHNNMCALVNLEEDIHEENYNFALRCAFESLGGIDTFFRRYKEQCGYYSVGKESPLRVMVDSWKEDVLERCESSAQR